MNTAMKLGIAALGIYALFAGCVGLRAQLWQPITTASVSGTTVSGVRFINVDSGGAVLMIGNPEPPPPQGSFFHQVVDVYYNADGVKLDARSQTHVVAYDCHGGLRREDAIAQDDGHGNVSFIQARLPNEPAEGVKKSSAEGILAALAAIKRSPHIEPTTLADAR